MGELGETSLHEVRDASGFIESMRRLKAQSDLTYRQLEARAAQEGGVLARSTLANVLTRTALPHPDLLATFVRACGDGQRVALWLETRDRIAANTAAASVAEPRPQTHAGSGAGAQAESEEAAHGRPRRAKGRIVALATLLIVPFLGYLILELRPDSSTAASRNPADGWVTIRPAGTPDLCLTDGRDRAGAYGGAVAVQLPCAQATVPRTYLEPVGEGLYRIQWHHPQNGKGCLTVMGADQIKGLLEPRDDCAQGTLFRVEAVSSAESEGFRLRSATSSLCVGLVDDDTTEGAEVIEEGCTGATDQQFLVRAG